MSGRRAQGVCRRDGCVATAQRRRLCSQHYAAFLRHRAAGGTPTGLVDDAASVAAHIRALNDAGVGSPRLAELTGINEATIQRLARGLHRPYQRTADAIFRVQVPDIPQRAKIASPGRRIPILGSTRRVQALVANGWTLHQISRDHGIERSVLTHIATGSQTWVFARTAMDIAAIFARMQMVRGSSAKAFNRARREGWPPPLCWDEETIDDPAAQPDWSAVARHAPRPGRALFMPPPEFAALVEDHRLLGRSDDDIAARLGMTLETFQRRLHRVGLPRQARAAS